MPTTMPSNRPFFANFFWAFRARTSPTLGAKSSNTTAYSSTLAASAHVSTTEATVTSTTRSIQTKAAVESTSNQQNMTVSSQTQKPPALPFTTTASSFYAPPLSRSPGTSSPNPAYNNPALSMSPTGYTTPMSRGRQRRGSDSSNSSGGFLDMGNDKWYIGGRTNGGEERFYPLSMVTSGAGKRVRSLDRLSM